MAKEDASHDSSSISALITEQFKAQEDRIEEFMKRSSAIETISRVAGDSAEIYEP